MGYSYTINVEEKKSSLDIFVGGEFETAYTYDNGMVTLSERPDAALLTPANYRTNLDFINKWYYQLLREFDTTSQSWELIKQDIDKTATKVDINFRLDNVLVTKAKYKFDELIFDFDPRPEVTMNFTTFKIWYDLLEQFYQATR